MSRTMFVVQQASWWVEMWNAQLERPFLHRMDGYQLYRQLRHRTLVQATPNSLLETQADAVAECRRLTLLAPPCFNPFWPTLGDRRSRQEQAFWDALFYHHVWDELTPEYGADPSEWCLWWEMCAPCWTDEQRNALWDALNIDLYHISEVEFTE